MAVIDFGGAVLPTGTPVPEGAQNYSYAPSDGTSSGTSTDPYGTLNTLPLANGALNPYQGQNQAAYNQFSANYATMGNPNGPSTGALGPSYQDWTNAGSPADYQGYVNTTTSPAGGTNPNGYNNGGVGGGLSSLLNSGTANMAQAGLAGALGSTSTDDGSMFGPQGYSQNDYQNFLSNYQGPVNLDGTASNIPPPSYDQWSQGVQQSNQQLSDPDYQNYLQNFQQSRSNSIAAPDDEPQSYAQFKQQSAMNSSMSNVPNTQAPTSGQTTPTQNTDVYYGVFNPNSYMQPIGMTSSPQGYSQNGATQTTSTPLGNNMATNPLSQYSVTPTTNSPSTPNIGATAGSPSGGSFTQGAALPNITTTQSQATAAPQFYTDYLNQIAQQGAQAAQNSQYVGAQPLQQQAFDQTSQNVGNYQPALQSAINLAGSVGNSNLYQAVGDLGEANIRRNLAPQTTAGLVGSGQFGSSRGASALGDTIANAELGVTAQQQAALQQDYANKLNASNALGNLAGQTQALGLGDVNALSTMGGQQQTIAQNQQNYPMSQLTNESALLRGYTMPTSTSSSYTGPIPGAYSASPLQQIAGLGALGAGISNTQLGQMLFGTADTTNPTTGAVIPGASGLIGKGLSSLINSSGSSGNTQVSDSNTNVPAGSVRNSDGTYTGPNGENYNADGSVIVPNYVGSTQPSVDYGSTNGIDTSTM